jgi:nitroreductase
MATTGSTPQTSFESRFGALEGVSLIDTIVRRRSRRFALGHELDGGPLSYRSLHDPVPLTAEEEAVIVFAGAGMTGYALSEAPFAPGREPESSRGNILVAPFGRTIATPDGINSAILFVINDDGAFQIRRPKDYPRESLAELAELARRREFVELYDRAKIRVTDHRPEVLRRPPVTPPFNRWSTNVPGSTYFVIVSDITPLLFSLIFFLLGEEMEFMVYDERNHYRPAGLRRFMRSKGGRLHDDPNDFRLGSILDFESYLMELVAVEQGLMLQNMQLAVEALGLGGFPHFGAQRYQWFEELGFRMEDISIAKLTRRGRVMTAAMNALGKNPIIPHPLGLEIDGEATVKPYCPPWYGSMEEAAHAFIDAKYGEGGVFTDGRSGPWRDVGAVQAGIEHYSQANIDAVVAYSEYVYGRYGRFPGNFGPLRSLMAYQAHHVDPEFYDRFYEPGAYHDLHREHFARWHGENGSA